MASKGKFEGAAVVSFRGQPLTDTPIKSKLPVRNARRPAYSESIPKCPNIPIIDEQQVAQNTKLNGQRCVRIETLKVIKENIRPPSPSAHFRERRPGVQDRPRALSSSPSPPTSRARRIIFAKEITHLDDSGSSLSHPPYYDTTFPLRPCLKRQKTTSDMGKFEDSSDNFVIVQKFIYPEDLPAAAVKTKPVATGSSRKKK